MDAYTLANSLFQTLRLTPIQAGFEHLVISFADVAYQYQANTARVLRQEPRRLLRARGISADHPDALGGMLDPEPGVAYRGHAHTRRNRRRDTRGMARRANSGMADHACSASATKSGKWCR